MDMIEFNLIMKYIIKPNWEELSVEKPWNITPRLLPDEEREAPLLSPTVFQMSGVSDILPEDRFGAYLLKNGYNETNSIYISRMTSYHGWHQFTPPKPSHFTDAQWNGHEGYILLTDHIDDMGWIRTVRTKDCFKHRDFSAKIFIDHVKAILGPKYEELYRINDIETKVKSKRLGISRSKETRAQKGSSKFTQPAQQAIAHAGTVSLINKVLKDNKINITLVSTGYSSYYLEIEPPRETSNETMADYKYFKKAYEKGLKRSDSDTSGKRLVKGFKALGFDLDEVIETFLDINSHTRGLSDFKASCIGQLKRFAVVFGDKDAAIAGLLEADDATRRAAKNKINK